MRYIKIFSLAAFVLLAFTVTAQQPTIKILESGKRVSIRGLSVVSDQVIWASGSGGTVAKSVDGGNTFTWMKVPGYEKTDFRDIEAFDENTAIIMGITAPAVLLKTIDGGKNWKKVFEDTTKGAFWDAMDFKDDVVLMGHDGPGHIAIAEGKTKVRPLKVYHGKVGKGVSVEMSVKNGTVTLLSIVEKAGKLILLVAEAESVSGPILQIGNTNSRYKFPIGARKFVNDWNSHGPAHHCAIGIGHISSKIEKLGALLNMEVVKVC